MTRKYFMIALEYEKYEQDPIFSESLEAVLANRLDDLRDAGVISHWEYPQVQEFSEDEIVALIE